MRRLRRVAIVGGDGFQRSDGSVEIECFSWAKVANIVNPSDYDTIVMNLVSLTKTDIVNWDVFFDMFTPRTTLEVLANGGNIVIIGDPRFWPIEPVHVPGQAEGSGREFLSWTGIQFYWDDKSGRSIKPSGRQNIAKLCQDYIEKISRWDYCLRDCNVGNEQLNSLSDVLRKPITQFSSKLNIEKICENRYGGLIAFAVRLEVTDMISHGLSGYRPGKSREGRIIFLPQIDETQEDVLSLVLTSILGISVVVPEPSWTSAIVAPGQPPIDARIAKIEHAIGVLESKLKSAAEEHQKARKCVHLLYKLGDDLEDVVWDVLGSLGSTVEPPTERGKEDGWLTVEIGDEIFEGVLEIKGTRKPQFPVDGLRQLMEWKKRGILNRNKKYKGIFVGNSGVEKDVSEREVPYVKSWEEAAELDDLVVLLTSDLYEVYRLDSEGKLDRNQFWSTLFAKKGVFSIADIS